MKGFDDVTLGWKSEEKVVPASQQLGLIMRIEDALAGASGDQALAVLLSPKGPPYARLAAAYGAALRYAGFNVADDEVYLSITRGLAGQDIDDLSYIQSMVINLISIVSPPHAMALLEGENTGKKAKPRSEK